MDKLIRFWHGDIDAEEQIVLIRTFGNEDVVMLMDNGSDIANHISHVFLISFVFEVGIRDIFDIENCFVLIHCDSGSVLCDESLMYHIGFDSGIERCPKRYDIDEKDNNGYEKSKFNYVTLTIMDPHNNKEDAEKEDDGENNEKDHDKFLWKL
jgi:hypothetical protein